MGLFGPRQDLDSLSDVVANNPTCAWIEPTNRCNTRCRHCEHFYADFGADMEKETFQKIFGCLGDHLTDVTLIGYGEPLAAKNFDLFFERCLSGGKRVSFTTNGILLRDRARLQKMVRLPVNIEFSIDGASKDTYEYVRPFIKWEHILATLENIRQVSAEAGENKKWRLVINFVVMRKNFKELPNMIELAANYGFDEVRALPFIPNTHEEISGEEIEESDEELSQALVSAYKKAQIQGIAFPLMGLFKKALKKDKSWSRRVSLVKSYASRKGLGGLVRLSLGAQEARARTGLKTCLFPWKSAYFTQEGKVWPCCIQGLELGDIAKQDWPEIWNGQMYRSLRRTIHSWNPPNVCRRCGFPAGINGGDSGQYEKFFAKYASHEVPFESAQYQKGFYEIERTAEGKPSHVWMQQQAQMNLNVPRGAHFIRFGIIPRVPGQFGFNCGTGQINHQPAEPFDNTCDQIVLPAKGVAAGLVEVQFKLENSFRVGEDPRDLALAIHKIEFLR